ncbi:MAG TPA: AI-2E family transporter [Sphingobium sp.]|uniref:AI-2E family transporter n=1 Tax=Sphingobium sp. TaxID=1912891 RepID=UPI002ED116C0
MESYSAERQAYWSRLVALCLLFVFGLWIAKDFIAALVWGLVIAIAIDPLHMRLRQRWPGRARQMVIALFITLGIALVVLIPLVVGIAQAAKEARDVALWIAAAKAHGVPPPIWLGHLPYGAPEVTLWWQEHLANPEAATTQLHSLAGVDLLTHGRLIGSNVLHRGVIFLFTLLALFFLLRDRDTIIAQLRAAGHRLLGDGSERIGLQAIKSIRGTIDGLVLVGLGEGVVMTIVYLLLGTPHPLLLGVLTAVAATIPFGAAVMFLIAALLLLGTGSVSGAIIVIVAGLIVVGIADHFIRPALIGGTTRLPFLWVLIGILGGAETLGVLGLFVGPATMAVLVMLWRDFTTGNSTEASG